MEVELLYGRQIELLYLISKIKQASRTRIQKLVFLSCVKSESPSFDFIPYHFGPYSVTLQNDLDYLVKKDFLVYTNDHYHIASGNVSCWRTKTPHNLDNVITRYKDTPTRDLMRYIYLCYPLFAVNSVVAQELLTQDEMASLKRFMEQKEEMRIYTIGYEGKSLEKYLLELFTRQVRLVVDVRASSYSMKKEFIGSRLASSCSLIGIEYLHLPELGIPNTYRKDYQDKSKLFKFYKNELLSNRGEDIRMLADYAQKEKRIALTCFEASHKDCHRHYLAEELYLYMNRKVSVDHI